MTESKQDSMLASMTTKPAAVCPARHDEGIQDVGAVAAGFILSCMNAINRTRGKPFGQVRSGVNQESNQPWRDAGNHECNLAGRHAAIHARKKENRKACVQSCRDESVKARVHASEKESKNDCLKACQLAGMHSGIRSWMQAGFHGSQQA